MNSQFFRRVGYVFSEYVFSTPREAPTCRTLVSAGLTDLLLHLTSSYPETPRSVPHDPLWKALHFAALQIYRNIQLIFEWTVDQRNSNWTILSLHGTLAQQVSLQQSEVLLSASYEGSAFTSHQQSGAYLRHRYSWWFIGNWECQLPDEGDLIF